MNKESVTDAIVRVFKGNALIHNKFHVAKVGDNFYISQSDMSTYITGSTKNSLRMTFRLNKDSAETIERIKVEKTNYVLITDLLREGDKLYFSDITRYRKVKEYENIKKLLNYLKSNVVPVCNRLRDRFERLGKDFDSEMDRGILVYYYYSTAINGANDKSKRYYVIKDENGEYFFELKQILYDIGWQLTTRDTDINCNAINVEKEISKENYKLCKTVVLVKGKGSPYINAKGLEELFSYPALSVYYDTFKSWYKNDFLSKYPEGVKTVFNDNNAKELNYLKKDYQESTPLMREEVEALTDAIEKDETMRTIPEIADVISSKENTNIRSDNEEEYRKFAKSYINNIALDNQKGKEESMKFEKVKVTLELNKSMVSDMQYIINSQKKSITLEEFIISMIEKSFKPIQNIIEEEQKTIKDLKEKRMNAINKILNE